MHISITRDALLDKLRENQELAKADDVLAKRSTSRTNNGP